MNLKKMPPVTKSILFTNIAVHLFILLQMATSEPGTILAIYQKFGLIPSAFRQGAIWQPLTSMFMHGIGGSMTFMHIAFNMIGVVSIGIFLEEAIGSIRFIVLYMISGIAGGFAVIFLSPDLLSPTIGASGALTGLLAAIAILTPEARVLFLFFIPMKIRTLAIGLFFVSLYYGIQNDESVISHWGHMGGLIGGFLYTIISGAKQEMQKRMGGFQKPQSPRQNVQDPMKKIFDEILKGRAKPYQKKADYGSYYNKTGNVEKEINPTDSTHEDNTTTPDSQDKSVFYDPKTGKFMIR